MKRSIKKYAMSGMLTLVLAGTGCGQGQNTGETGRVISTLSGSAIVRKEDPELVRKGEAVFRRHCAACHGRQAEGAPDWRRRGEDGFYPPPPLNGTGHAWHHPTAMLRDMIRNGSPPGQGRMPAWGDKLSAEEIDAVIAWFQSLWPDEVYAAWYDREQRFLK